MFAARNSRSRSAARTSTATNVLSRAINSLERNRVRNLEGGTQRIGQLRERLAHGLERGAYFVDPIFRQHDEPL